MRILVLPLQANSATSIILGSLEPGGSRPDGLQWPLMNPLGRYDQGRTLQYCVKREWVARVEMTNLDFRTVGRLAAGDKRCRQERPKRSWTSQRWLLQTTAAEAAFCDIGVALEGHGRSSTAQNHRGRWRFAVQNVLLHAAPVRAEQHFNLPNDDASQAGFHHQTAIRRLGLVRGNVRLPIMSGDSNISCSSRLSSTVSQYCGVVDCRLPLYPRSPG